MVTLYNQDGEKIGETYPRRAKQLIKNGRAAWLCENISLQLIPTSKEDSIMADTNIPIDNGSQDDKLLMYLARKNVQDKKNFKRHVIALFAVLVLILTIYQSYYSNTSYSFNPGDRLDVLLAAHRKTLENVWATVEYSNELQWQVMSNHTDSFNELHDYTRIMKIQLDIKSRPDDTIWVFISIAMVVWAFYILHRGIKIFKRDGTAKPDPVLTEYERLKGITEKIILE